jgi:hypothetical protein
MLQYNFTMHNSVHKLYLEIFLRNRSQILDPVNCEKPYRHIFQIFL